jgi:CheY-like chemotaxis protein
MAAQLPRAALEAAALTAVHRVLLVDDDPVTLHTVGALLRKFGYGVTTASSGREAMQLLQEATTTRGHETPPFDLVLTDLRMPEVSGFDLVHEVVHGEAFSGIPVVVMSSVDSQESVIQVCLLLILERSCVYV